jgi:antitoxin StbD
MFMATWMGRFRQAVPLTEFIRFPATYLNTVIEGNREKLVLMRNNNPAAVLLNIHVYESLMDELEDLLIEAIAASRLVCMNTDTQMLIHEDVFADYEKNDVG